MFLLKKIREEKGLTQQKLSEKIKLSRSTIAMYETGGSEPDLLTLSNLADILGTSVDQLLGRESSPAVVTINQAVTPELSDNKKQLIEMIQQLSEDDTVIALGIIARLNNQPINDIIKKIN